MVRGGELVNDCGGWSRDWMRKWRNERERKKENFLNGFWVLKPEYIAFEKCFRFKISRRNFGLKSFRTL